MSVEMEMRLFETASNQGFSDAQYVLGKYYEAGDLFGRARVMYKKASDQVREGFLSGWYGELTFPSLSSSRDILSRRTSSHFCATSVLAG